MELKITEGEIVDLKIIDLGYFEDHRGVHVETYNEEAYTKAVRL